MLKPACPSSQCAPDLAGVAWVRRSNVTGFPALVARAVLSCGTLRTTELKTIVTNRHGPSAIVHRVPRDGLPKVCATADPSGPEPSWPVPGFGVPRKSTPFALARVNSLQLLWDVRMGRCLEWGTSRPGMARQPTIFNLKNHNRTCYALAQIAH
jgi:hypothetical protein